MKKTIVSAAAVLILAGASIFVNWGYGQAPKAATQEAAPHRIGLIDMAYIFKEYKKFNVLREDLKQKIEESDSKAKGMAEKIKGLQTELNGFTSGSPEYLQAERNLAKATSDFEAFRKLAQREFLREESQIYKTIYLEVNDMTDKYAKYYHYTLIMRFSRDDLKTTDDPPDIIKNMNRQVVYFRPEDDITDHILEHLNSRYASQGGQQPRSTPPREARKGAAPTNQE